MKGCALVTFPNWATNRRVLRK